MDPFNMAYSYDRWRALRLNPDVKPGDAPRGTFPAPESETVSFRDLATFQRRVVNTVDRSRFGPEDR